MSGKNILIVDDASCNHKYIENVIVEQRGKIDTIYSARFASQTKEICEAIQPDVIFIGCKWSNFYVQLDEEAVFLVDSDGNMAFRTAREICGENSDHQGLNILHYIKSLSFFSSIQIIVCGEVGNRKKDYLALGDNVKIVSKADILEFAADSLTRFNVF